MVSQTLDKIIAAERLAAEKVDFANNESVQIISLANQKAAELMDKANLESAAEISLMIQKNKAEMDRIMRDGSLSKEEELSIKESADRKKDHAVEMVIKIITKQ